MRLAVALAAVDDPVPDRRQVVPPWPPVSQPTHQGVQRRGVIRQIMPALLERIAAGVREAQAAAAAAAQAAVPAPDPARLRT